MSFLVADLRSPISISYSGGINGVSLPSYLNCGNDLFILLKKEDERVKYFFDEFIKCVFKKENVNKLKIYLTEEQYLLLKLSDNFKSIHFVENIDENFLILIEKENIIGK